MKNSFYSFITALSILFSVSISAEEQSWIDALKSIPSTIIQTVGTLTRKIPLFWILHNTMTCSDCRQNVENFLIAAQKGDIETIKQCLANDVRINIQDEHGNTALHLATLHGHKEIVQLLLKTRLDNSYFAILCGKRAHILKNKNGETPVHCAACQDDTTLLELLLKQNNFANNQKKHPNDDGLTPLLLAVYYGKINNALLLIKEVGHTQRDKNKKTILHIAVERNHKNLIEHLVQFKDLINSVDKKGNTPLIYANNESFNILAQHGADITKCSSDGTWLHSAVKKNDPLMISTAIAKNIPLDAKDSAGNTAVMYAGKANNITVCNQLFDAGVNINLQNNAGDSLLHIAALNGYLELTKELVSRKNIVIDVKDNNGKTPLHIAGLKNNELIADLLLDNGAKINERTDLGNTIIAIAADSGNDSLLSRLIKRPGADVNICDTSRITPLMKAVTSGNRLSVIMLLNSGAQTSSRDNCGQTALHFAANTDSLLITKDLLEKNHLLLNATDFQGNSPLHIALQNRHSSTAKLFIMYKAPLTIFNTQGNTPLHEATLINDSELVEIMLQRGAPIVQNKQGYLPTHIAMQKTNNRVIEIFFRYGANFLTSTSAGDSHAHIAAQYGNVEALSFLKNKGIDMWQKNSQYKTPFDDAAYNGHLEAVQFFIQKYNVSPIVIENTIKHASSNFKYSVVNFLTNENKAVKTECENILHIQNTLNNLRSSNSEKNRELIQKDKYVVAYQPSSYAPQHYTMTQLLSWQQSERTYTITNLLYFQSLETQEKTRIEQKLAQIKEEERKRAEENEKNRLECETILRIQKTIQEMSSANDEKYKELLKGDQYAAVSTYQPTNASYYTNSQLLFLKSTERKKIVEELLKSQATEQQEKTKLEQKLIEQKNALEKQLADKTKQDTKPSQTTQTTQAKQEEKNEECCICLDEKPDAKAIPCKHCKQGSSRICVACLTEIAKKSNKCPMCNKDTLEAKQ